MMEQETFWNRMQQIHLANQHGIHAAAGNLMRQNLEWLLKNTLSIQGMDVAQIDQLQLSKLYNKAEALLDEEPVRNLIKYLGYYTNIASHDRRGVSLDREMSSYLFHLLLLLYFWFNEKIFGNEEIAIDVFQRTFGQTALTQDMQQSLNEDLIGSEIAENTSEVNPELLQIFNNKQVAIHRNAIRYSQELKQWQRPILSTAIISLNLNMNLPYIKKTRKAGALELVKVTSCNLVSVMAVQLADVYTILYIGAPLNTDEWIKAHSIVTNGKNYLEILKQKKEVSSDGVNNIELISDMLQEDKLFHHFQRIYSRGEDNLAAETKELIYRKVNASKVNEYSQTCESNSGFAQSNIALLNNDQELQMALKYPLDDWRLFLHPTQQETIKMPAKNLFVEGGPGTGKTVVLIHRLIHRVKERIELEQKMSKFRFRVLLLTFSKALSENIASMVRKIDPNIMKYVFLKDIHSFIKIQKEGLVTIESHPTFLQLYVFHQGKKFGFWLTDIFFDEFQDFPTKKENITINLVKKIDETKAGTLTCTFDAHQSIFHEQTDMGFWGKIIQYKYQKLDYCYRMAKEISNTSFDHRKVMLDYARDMMSLQDKTPQDYQLGKEAPVYAFEGGDIRLVPARSHMQLKISEKLIRSLLKKYNNSEIGLIFFESGNKSSEKEIGIKDVKIDIRNMEMQYKIRTYNILAVKGLEFRAGVIVFAHNNFLRYQKYINEGIKFANLDKMVRAMQKYLKEYAAKDKFLKQLDKIPSEEYVDDRTIAHFLHVLKYINKNNSFDHENPLTVYIKKEGVELNDQDIAQKILKNVVDKNVIFVINKINQSKGTALKKALTNAYSITESALEKLLEYSYRSRRKKLQDEEINVSLRELNEFYVALTRFREEIFIIYDDYVELEKLVPGARVVHQFQEKK